MPIVGFSILGIGGILIYSGYLGYSPVKVVKAFIDNTTSELVRVPIDPRQRTGYTPPQSDGTYPTTPGTDSTDPRGVHYGIYNPQQQTQGNVVQA
jgi:hypothetical protein